MLVVVTHSAALAERFPVRYEMNAGTLSERDTNVNRRSRSDRSSNPATPEPLNP